MVFNKIKHETLVYQIFNRDGFGRLNFSTMNTLTTTFSNGATKQRQTDWNKQQCEDYYLNVYFDIDGTGNVLQCVKIDLVEHLAPLDQQLQDIVDYLDGI